MTVEDRNLAQLAPINGNQSNPVYSQPLVVQTQMDADEEMVDLRQLWMMMKHRMRLIGAITLGVTALIAWWTFQQEPKYLGKFQLLIESTTDNTQLNKLMLQGTGLDETDYETQIEVLRSPRVLDPILEQLVLKYPDLDYKTLTEKPAKLKIKQVDKTKILEVSYEDTDTKQIKFVLDKLAQAYLQYGLEEYKSEIQQGISFVAEQLPGLRNRVNNLQEQLQKFRQKHNLLNPEQQAERLSEQLSDLESQYLDTQVKLKETTTLYAILQQQLGVDPSGAIAASYLSESSRYQKLLDQLQDIEIDLAKESVRFSPNNPVIKTLQEKRDNLLPLLQEEAYKVLGNKLSGSIGNSPDLASPSSLRLDLNQQFVQTTNNIQVLQIRRLGLEQGIQALKSQIKEMPLIARQYTDLKRELDVATGSLNRFLEAEEKLQIDGAQKASPWQMIAKPEEPEKDDPISPKPLRNMSLGVFLGLILGLGAAFLAERLDPVFHSAEELKDATKLPLLGFIPLQKDLKSIEQVLEKTLSQITIGNTNLTVDTSDSPVYQKSHGYKSLPFIEAFRSLSTNIRLLGSDSSMNSLVISSSQPSEGKSTVSVHLAQAAAAMGQRVLLIDADLRRPQVHLRLGLPNNQGFSNVLATGLELKTAIQAVPHWENLSVLTAGDIPPDPTRLLASARMQQVREQLQQEGLFDLIIYDTPPLLGFADGKILAAYTMGIILVIKMGKTDRSALKNSIDELGMSQVPVLGIVANGISSRNHSSYYAYNRYYGRRK